MLHLCIRRKFYAKLKNAYHFYSYGILNEQHELEINGIP